MTALDNLSDELHRTVKLALDTGEAVSVEDAVRIFSAYRVQLVLGPEAAESAVLQAAALTAVNCATRTLLGGVSVIGAQGPLRVALPPFKDLSDAVEALGAGVAAAPHPNVPSIVFGSPPADAVDRLAIRVVVRGWSGGVAPLIHDVIDGDPGGITTAGVLAGALAVSEVFQRLRGHPMACRRAVGLNLWRPELDWLTGEQGPALMRLPSCAWLVGLGNLGQAYLWTLGLLPYGDGSLDLMLQDFDLLATSNVSTSLLTTPGLVGQRKSRAMAAWAERRGFRASIIERRFAADFRVNQQEPSVALVGVDNALARQVIEDVGFERVIEAGLGRGPQDFLGIDLHTFPAATAARAVWQSGHVGDAEISQPAYRELLERSGDRCGTVRLAGRSIGAPFVGAVAATFAVAELLRLVAGGRRNELVSCHLRDLSLRTVIPGTPWLPFNPGAVVAAPALPQLTGIEVAMAPAATEPWEPVGPAAALAAERALPSL
jgi:hypothetical protein